jgi:sugar phosphate isomerase/epimerase
MKRRNFIALGGMSIVGCSSTKTAVIDAAKSKEYSGLKLSLAAYSMRSKLPNFRNNQHATSDYQMEDFIEQAAKWQVDGVELTSYFLPDPCPRDRAQSLKRLAHVNGLDITGGAIGNNFTYSPGSSKAKEQMEYTRRWIETYGYMGAPVIRVFAGNPDKEADKTQAVKNIIENLKAACYFAEQSGVILAMENHDFTTNIDRYLEIIDAVDSPWFGANLDSGNLAKTADPYADLARIAPHAVNAQIKVVIPVNGIKQAADFERLIQILKDANYKGYVVLEYEEEADPLIEIPKYLGRLRELI